LECSGNLLGKSEVARAAGNVEEDRNGFSEDSECSRPESALVACVLKELAAEKEGMLSPTLSETREKVKKHRKN
jgi:hypothetical protein